MKLIVQIPCYNEEETLPEVIKGIPQSIEGIDTIELLIIDDGSTDRTVEIAKELGVTHIVKNACNKGLARSFSRGIDEALRRGADIIVNTDGDNQYASEDIAKLVKPIVDGSAEVVVGDRGGMNNPHFSFFKRCLQVVGSSIIRKLSGVSVTDAVSGFRAMSRDAAKQLNILSEFSYTIEMLIQSGSKRIKVVSVPIGTNPKTRESRLFGGVGQFLKMSGLTLVRTYTMYKPLRVLTILASIEVFVGMIPIVRFLFFYVQGNGGGHIQSLILGSMLIILGAITFLIGVVSDLISFNRKLVEKNILQVSQLSEKLEELEGRLE